jgi:hypothetical protein
MLESKARFQSLESTRAMQERIKLSELMPSQFLIDETKLADLLQNFDMSQFSPIPVKEIEGVFMITDGHHRVCVADLMGYGNIPVVEEIENLDWEAYRQNMRDCLSRGVSSALDLKSHIVPSAEYHAVWDAYCDEVHQSVRKANQRLKTDE